MPGRPLQPFWLSEKRRRKYEKGKPYKFSFLHIFIFQCFPFSFYWICLRYIPSMPTENTLKLNDLQKRNAKLQHIIETWSVSERKDVFGFAQSMFEIRSAVSVH